MSLRSLRKQIERAEKIVEHIAHARSRSSKDCICFPESEPPFFYSPTEQKIAFGVKCPLHGDRFKGEQYFVYVSEWMWEKRAELLRSKSPQYQKAWAASFPTDFDPAVQEETDTHVCEQKDGSGRPSIGLAARQNRCSSPSNETGSD